MLVTAVLEPMTRICADSCFELGKLGAGAGEVSSVFEDSLNMRHFLNECNVTNTATKLFYLNDTNLVTFTFVLCL